MDAAGMHSAKNQPPRALMASLLPVMNPGLAQQGPPALQTEGTCTGAKCPPVSRLSPLHVNYVLYFPCIIPNDHTLSHGQVF